ncbi:hypothetical protein ACP70R_021772 [Stipagrostis hirtigluma subsp. patula]
MREQANRHNVDGDAYDDAFMAYAFLPSTTAISPVMPSSRAPASPISVGFKLPHRIQWLLLESGRFPSDLEHLRVPSFAAEQLSGRLHQRRPQVEALRGDAMAFKDLLRAPYPLCSGNSTARRWLHSGRAGKDPIPNHDSSIRGKIILKNKSVHELGGHMVHAAARDASGKKKQPVTA